MPTGIKNVSLEPLALPTPYEGLVPPGQMAIVADSPAQVLAALGGGQFATRLVQMITLPTGTALTIHGSANLDETLSATGAANVIPQTTRLDPATAGASFTVSLPNGLYSGYRKRFYQMSQAGGFTATIQPGVMAESKTKVALSSLGAWCELEWQAGPTAANAFGWKVIALGGTTGPAVVIT